MSISKTSNERKEVKGVKINISEYARQNNISWNTAKRRLTSGSYRRKRKINKKSKLDDYMEIIEVKLTNYNCSATAIYYFIKEKGYTGSLSLVIKQVSKMKAKLHKKATLRVETTPGLQAQVDWKETVTLRTKDKEEYTINIFLYVLSYSKFKYIELTVDRTQKTLFTCMKHAIEYCGGSPEEIWFDNMKTVVDSHDINTNEVKFNDKFIQFAKDCQFKAIACKPYRPCTKGIAENVAKLMNRLQVYNDEFEDYDELNAIVKRLNTNLNLEVSQATNRVCVELFEENEKEYLAKINLDHLNFKPNVEIRKVSNESMVMYENAKYSVPTEYLHELVEVQRKDNQLYIHYKGKEIACHTISTKRFNYRKNDLTEIVKTTFPNASEASIEQKVEERLQGYDCFGKARKRK
ncbi:transposase [Breznakia blatticola]|uniref:Transposase n=1 Tax=Breznakia blatticola TaxID=1754012 RepID=A0A4V3G623_9FIRM|nr:IS21 family transposase [Breznakia blatticola]TDW07920.1 transposase [Breznakia blatticola]